MRQVHAEERVMRIIALPIVMVSVDDDDSGRVIYGGGYSWECFCDDLGAGFSSASLEDDTGSTGRSAAMDRRRRRRRC